VRTGTAERHFDYLNALNNLKVSSVYAAIIFLKSSTHKAPPTSTMALDMFQSAAWKWSNRSERKEFYLAILTLKIVKQKKDNDPLQGRYLT
jgi:hypothetical protein